MALSLTPMRTSPKKKKPTTLQAEQTAVAKPIALQPTKPQPTATKPPPSAPRETVAPIAPMPTKPTLTGDIKTPTAPQATAPAMTTFSDAPRAEAPVGEGASESASMPNLSMGISPKTTTTSPNWMDRFRSDTKTLPQPPAPAPVGEGAEESEEDVVPQTDEQFDQEVRRLMSELLTGEGMDVDTAEEEALIKQLMEDRLGQGLVEQRARMGRAGFGASGALAAMEGDVRRQAGQQATQETLGLRRQAEQEAIDNALRAIGVDVEKRREGRQAVFDQEFLNALKAALGMSEPGGETGGDAGSVGGSLAGPAQAVMDLANATILNQGAGDETTVARSGAGRDAGVNAGNPIIVSAPPDGATLVNPNASFGGALYLGKDGKYYGVKK